MTKHPEHSEHDQAIGLLLAGNESAEGYAAARALLAHDRELRDELDSLQRVGASLAEVADALYTQVERVDLRDAVLDSIAHLACEQLGVAESSPYAAVERELKQLKTAFDAHAGQISLTDEIMAAAAASRKTDSEVERPFAQVAMELNSLGTAANSAAPEVDIVEPILERVAQTRATQTNVVPLRARPAIAEARPVTRERATWPIHLGWAAAITVCAGAAWLYSLNNPANPRNNSRLAANPEQPDPVANQHDIGFTRVSEYSGSNEVGMSTQVPAPPTEGPRARIKEPLTLQDAINARRRDLLSQDVAFDQLASLTEEEASELLKTKGISLEALLGAVQYLSDEDAVAALRAAIAENPDAPYLKLALAMKLEGDPTAADERLQYLNQLASATSDNSLPNYMLATDYFARGEMALGLDALSKGAAYTNASAYSLEGARQREAALIASGLGRDEARFLALSTAGSGEYDNIASLRDQLLEYGAYYESLEDYDTANQIYEAVNQLGTQLYEGADLAIEQQYGLETRHDALSAIQGIAEVLQQPESIALLGDTLGRLAGGIVEITQYIAERQELVTNSALANQVDWTSYLDRVIHRGDLESTDATQ